jgi:DnaJ-class molecular chaperone
VIVTVKEHDVFTRKGNDIYMTKKISLIESLTGFNFNLKLLNELLVLITSGEEQLIRHGDVMKIPNLGMHHYKNSMSNGDLFITFEVLYPAKLSGDQKEQLKSALPKGILP